MLLKDELERLNDEFEALRLLQKNNQQNVDDKLQHFALKLEKLSLLVDKNSVDYKVNEARISEPCLEPDKPEFVLYSASSDHFEKSIPQLVKSELKEPPVNQLGGFFVSFFTALFAPVAMLTGPLSSFYLHYQKRGLAPVFLMTVAGIITLTVGFGYLLQYSVTHWLSEFSKVMLAFGFANSIIVGAVFLHKKRPEMQDFASSLVGLGLILNYLSGYFTGPYFQLVSPMTSFILLLFISLSGFIIAVKLETKVVSICTLIGGSLAPVMLLSDGHLSLLYLPYLLIIGGCALMQSRLLKWPVLMQVTILLHISCIELFLLYFGPVLTHFGWQEMIALLSVNGLFYFYGTMLLTDQMNTVKLSKLTVTLLFTLLTFVLLVNTQLTHFSGEIFIINSVICSLLFLLFKKNKQLSALLLVFVGSFAGFATLQLVSADMLGLVLLLEALLLLWLGVKESYIAVRFEAYLLLASGIISNIIGFAGKISEANYQLLHFSQQGITLIYLSLSALALYSSKILLAELAFDKSELFIEKKIQIIIKELLSLSYIASFLFAGYLIDDVYYLHFIPFVSLLLLYLASKDKLRFTEIVAWLLLLPLLVMVIFAIINTGSVSFSLQPLYAQLARVELFICLLFVYYWYKRYFHDSKIVKLAYYLQLVCFIVLPLLFLPKVLRYYNEFSSLAFLLSSLISLSLARFVKHRILILQAKIITLLTMLVIVLSCLQMLWQGVVTLIIGAVLMALLFYRYPLMGALSKLIVKWQWQLIPYYFALLIAVICYSLATHWGLVFAVLAVYFTLLVQRSPVPVVIRSSYALHYGLIFICVLFPLPLHFELSLLSSQTSLLTLLSEMIILAVLGQLVISRGSAVRFYQKALPLNLLYGLWHTLLLTSYLLWSYQLDDWVGAPLSAILMVIHASWLMFISLKPQLTQMVKLAGGLFALVAAKILFIDMLHFEIIQKVIAFMFIGAILLGVSYFYQRVLNRYTDSIELQK